MYKKFLSTLLLVMIVNFVFSQNDYATINIYRTKAFCIGCSVKILLNDVYMTQLENGGKLELKIFNTNGTKITITDGNNYRENVTFRPRKGETYYFNAQARTPRALGFRLDRLDKPIKTKKLKPERFVSMSDVGVLDNNTTRNPDTEWTEEKLKKHWADNGSKDIEGIYEKVSTSLEYELAVLKENNEYKLIYLAGASGTSWNEGDIKATLKKTAQFGLFKANWFMLNKSFNNDIIITFKNATMSCLSENGKDKKLYIKTYPTYDEVTNDNSLTSGWKGNGTGFFISKDGLITTNYHVIKDASEIVVEFLRNGKKISLNATIVQSDKQNDLAILKIQDNSFKSFETIPYNFKTDISDVGSSVFALGYPMALTIMGKEIKFTDGKISSKTGYQGDISSYQTTTPIQPGNSGGPLFDYEGNLIGINASILRPDFADNVSYSIKSSYLKNLVDVLPFSLSLPSSKTIANKSLTEKIKILSDYVVLIKVR